MQAPRHWGLTLPDGSLGEGIGFGRTVISGARHYGALGGAVAGCQERSSVVGFALWWGEKCFGCVTAAHFLIGSFGLGGVAKRALLIHRGGEQRQVNDSQARACAHRSACGHFPARGGVGFQACAYAGFGIEERRGSPPHLGVFGWFFGGV